MSKAIGTYSALSCNKSIAYILQNKFILQVLHQQTVAILLLLLSKPSCALTIPL